MADNLEIALRISADVGSALRAVRGLGKETADAAKGADRLGKETADAAKGVDRFPPCVRGEPSDALHPL